MYIVHPLREFVHWQTHCEGQQKKKRAARNTFSNEEDKRLNELVATYGMDWVTISREMPGRNARQVKERWKNYLSSDVEHRPWTSDEDDLLYEKYREFGPKWKEISRFFEKRTEVHVKNRWRLLQRAELRKARQWCKQLAKEAASICFPQLTKKNRTRYAKTRCISEEQTEFGHSNESDVDTDDYLDPLDSNSFMEATWELCDDSFLLDSDI